VTRAPQPTIAPAEISNPSEWRLELRGSYLNAKYSELESRLTNGATALGFGVSHRIPSLAMTSAPATLEGRLAIDVLHGLDQSVTPENIRMMLVRGDVMAFVPWSFVSDAVTPYVSGGLGYATYSVRSVRSVDGNTLTVRRHASGSALALIPALGARVRLSTDLSLDLQAEYLALLGGESSASVGGLGVNAAVGFKF
jgi:opacity protein-like surface antigen